MGIGLAKPSKQESRVQARMAALVFFRKFITNELATIIRFLVTNPSGKRSDLLPTPSIDGRGLHPAVDTDRLRKKKS